MAIDRRAFLASAGAMLGCSRRAPQHEPVDSAPSAPPDAGPPPAPIPTYALFDAFPALATSLPRIELGAFPSPIESAAKLLDERLYVKRDDTLASIFGGGKLRKLELYLGDARALGKRRVVTFGGVGSNQAVAAALLGRAHGFEVALYLAPQPPSSLTTANLGADAASGAELRLFPSVVLAQATAARELATRSDTYLIAPGGTTPLGTLGFVSAGLELAADVRAGKMPAPKRVYIALGLGGSAVGLALGCKLGGLATEIVAVRASNPTTVSDATLRAIHDATIAFARARDSSFPTSELSNVRIDGRFVGAGYGAPTAAGNAAVDRARETEGLALDPVYTGKAVAAVLADAAPGPILFWNTQNSRRVPVAPVPPEFQRFLR